MRTLDRWFLSVVLRKSSILKNVCCFSTVQIYGELLVPANLFLKKCILTCKKVVIFNHSK